MCFLRTRLLASSSSSSPKTRLATSSKRGGAKAARGVSASSRAEPWGDASAADPPAALTAEPPATLSSASRTSPGARSAARTTRACGGTAARSAVTCSSSPMAEASSNRDCTSARQTLHAHARRIGTRTHAPLPRPTSRTATSKIVKLSVERVRVRPTKSAGGGRGRFGDSSGDASSDTSASASAASAAGGGEAGLAGETSARGGEARIGAEAERRVVGGERKPGSGIPEAALVCGGGPGEVSRSWPRKERRRMRAPRRAADQMEFLLERSYESLSKLASSASVEAASPSWPCVYVCPLARPSLGVCTGGEVYSRMITPPSS
eukprot:scaffold95286_cov60-Phaeocystis_antarctica.AAC.5